MRMLATDDIQRYQKNCLLTKFLFLIITEKELYTEYLLENFNNDHKLELVIWAGSITIPRIFCRRPKIFMLEVGVEDSLSCT